MEVFLCLGLRKIPRNVLLWGELVRGIKSINTITSTDKSQHRTTESKT